MSELGVIKELLSIFDERSPALLRRAIEEELGYSLSGGRIDELQSVRR
jgi:hypothetical protein